MFAKNRRCSKYRFFLKAACLQRAAAIVQASQLLGSGVLDHFFFDRVNSDNFFSYGARRSCKDQPIYNYRTKTCPHIIKTASFRISPIFLHVKSRLTCLNKRSGPTVQHAKCKISQRNQTCIAGGVFCAQNW